MTFWETGVELWSTAHFLCNSDRSRGLRGGAWGTAPLFLDQTEAQRAEKNFGDQAPPPLLSQGLVTSPLPLSEVLDPPLYNNIATTHLCLQSLYLPCSPCGRKILRYFESQNLRLACGLLQRMKHNINYQTT